MSDETPNVGDSRRCRIELGHLSEFPRKRRGLVFDDAYDLGRRGVDGGRDIEFKLAISRDLRFDLHHLVDFEQLDFFELSR